MVGIAMSVDANRWSQELKATERHGTSCAVPLTGPTEKFGPRNRKERRGREQGR